MKNKNLSKLYLVDEDLGGTEWTSKEVPVDYLQTLGLEDSVYDIACKNCDSDEMYIYVSITKETFSGMTQYIISVLALEQELDNKALAQIRDDCLDTFVTMLSYMNLMDHYTSLSLILGDDGERCLSTLFEVLRTHRLYKVLCSLLTPEEQNLHIHLVYNQYREAVKAHKATINNPTT